MKQRWIPAALMGCAGIGFLTGSLGRAPRVEVYVAPSYQPIPAPAGDVAPLPPADPPPGEFPTLPVPSSPSRELPSPVPGPLTDDGLGEYPAWNGVDLDCGDIGHSVRVAGPDPHDLDRDGDGVGCDGE